MVLDTNATKIASAISIVDFVHLIYLKESSFIFLKLGISKIILLYFEELNFLLLDSIN
jgi:hypothetical protein